MEEWIQESELHSRYKSTIYSFGGTITERIRLKQKNLKAFQNFEEVPPCVFPDIYMSLVKQKSISLKYLLTSKASKWKMLKVLLFTVKPFQRIEKQVEYSSRRQPPVVKN